MRGHRRWLVGLPKRAIDVGGAAVGLAVLSPVIAVVALIVRVRMGPPALFCQDRAGLGGRPITVSKMRTMTVATGLESEQLADVDRLTPLGRRVRASSLDELPQLWSVLKGDMSLVGPRPLPLAYVERYSREQRRRLDAKPGITGWAQVRGRNALSWPEKLALDVWYVDNASLRVDVAIVLRTVSAVLRRGGVNAEGHATMPEFMGES